MTPQRIQLRRTRGWRLPEGAVSVARPTRWGNPFTIVRIGDKWTVGPGDRVWASFPAEADAIRAAVNLYALHIGPMGNYEIDPDHLRAALAGRDLACWCPLPAPGDRDWCHGAVLLGIANRLPTSTLTGLPCTHPADRPCNECATDEQIAASLPQCREAW